MRMRWCFNVCSCLNSEDWFLYLFPQEHAKFFSWLWLNLWLSRCWDRRKHLWQTSHSNGRILKWIRRCCHKVWRVLNFIPQNSHRYRDSATFSFSNKISFMIFISSALKSFWKSNFASLKRLTMSGSLCICKCPIRQI